MNLYQSKQAGYFSSARKEIIPLLPPAPKRVLEVGCGSGQTLALIRDLLQPELTIGIELFPDAAKQAATRADIVHCLDVERQALPESLGRFDLILLLDVLEHLVDPWAFLQKLTRQTLAPEGQVIVSLPNAQHFSLSIALLFGQFRYAERGILDKTHLRFFTQASSRELLESAQLEIQKTQRTSLSPRIRSGMLNLATFGLFSNFLTSQFIYLASAKNSID